MRNTKWLFLIVLVVGGFILPAGVEHAIAQDAPADSERIQVVTKVIEPFVFKDQDRLTGYSIDLWQEISLLTELSFEYVEVETVGQQFEALAAGEADIAIAAISMTPEREEDFDFSYPYYRAGLQLMVKNEPSSPFRSLFIVLFSSRFLSLAGYLLLILIIVSHVIWLLERKNNPDFPTSYRKGVWEGLWWTVVTLTTVGYGDRRVKDKAGRILAMIWMFAGIILVANFTAVVTAELTTTRLERIIDDVDDLRRRRVATVGGTTSSDFLRQQGIPYLPVTHIDEAYALLDEDRVDVIVYDAPVLQYYVATAGQGEVEVVGSPFQLEDYGIAMPSESPYEEIINLALLELKANGTMDELARRWFITHE